LRLIERAPLPDVGELPVTWQIPRDLASLQSLLIEMIRRELGDRSQSDPARAVERLAQIFGAVQGR
jgi:hypothetical protein